MRNFFLMAVIIMIACGGNKSEQKTAVTEKPDSVQISRSVLMVIAPSDFRDEEFKVPFDLLTKAGVKVTIASTDTAPANGMLGMVVRPQILISNVNPEEYDALIIIGGTGCKLLWDNDILHGMLQRFNEVKKTIGAICIAPVVLARAKILKDRKATVFSGVKDELIKEGAEYSGADVEVCGHIITGSGPGAATAFAEAILKNLVK